MLRGIAVSILALAIGSAASAQLRPTPEDIESYRGNSTLHSYPEAPVVAWERDLREQLKRSKPVAAADALAPRYGLPPATMRRLVAAWIVTQAKRFAPDKNWQAGARVEWLALAPMVRQAPIGLPLAAAALDSIDECSATPFAALLRGAEDRATDAYRIALAAPCGDNFARAAEAAPDRAMPSLIRLADYGDLPLRDTLPLYAWLTSPEALSRVAEPDRAAITTMLWQRYFAALFQAGLETRALALLDTLAPDVRAEVMSPAYRPPRRAVVDGIAMTFDRDGDDMATFELADGMSAMADALEKGADPQPATTTPVPDEPTPQAAETAEAERSTAPILSFVEALAMAGRDAEARALLVTLPGLAQARAAAATIYMRRDDDRTNTPPIDALPMDALVVDHLLNQPDADPYPIAEILFGGIDHGETPVGAKVRCRVFPENGFPGLCQEGRRQAAPDLDRSSTFDRDAPTTEAVLRRIVPDFTARQAAMRAEAGPTSDTASHADRASRPAPAAPFAEQPIPADRRGSAMAAKPPGLAPLPSGYALVRAERTGQRAVAISLSQALDPTGEVSRGGYWVHVSDDGGQHWQAPLYTGLADRFPYVVPEAARLPLIDGDMLNLAVEVAELDTASITYPPVALRTRRRAKDLYLAIPLADLRRDSDGDGWTDITARHLLLDRPRAAGQTPFLVGSDSGAACPAPSRERLARIGLLSHLFAPSGAAIVEPMDRPPGAIGLGGQGGVASPSPRQPLFLLGQAEDYRCLRAARPIIVYGAGDIPALEARDPDFHAIAVPPILFNRARDRGFVRWSTGWSGGTFRLRWVDGRWTYDVISSWIS